MFISSSGGEIRWLIFWNFPPMQCNAMQYCNINVHCVCKALYISSKAPLLHTQNNILTYSGVMKMKNLIESVQYQYGKWFWNSLLTISLFNALNTWIILHCFDVLWCAFELVFFTLKIENICRKVFAFFLLEFTASLFSMALPLVLSPTLRVVEMFSLLYEVCQVF